MKVCKIGNEELEFLIVIPNDMIMTRTKDAQVFLVNSSGEIPEYDEITPGIDFTIKNDD